MAGRVVLFGATGYTGRLTALAMVRAGMAPVLAGRNEDALVELVAELAAQAPIDAAPTWQVADVSEASTVRALVSGPDDVLVTTVGPFARLGRPALDAAIDQGCGYVDSTGEPGFIRHVFEVGGPHAERTGARLLTAFGFDYVPGNLAGALAIGDAEALTGGPSRVEVGYFPLGSLGISRGTMASLAGVGLERPYTFRGGRISESGSGGVKSFLVNGRRRDALPVGASEMFALPRLDPRVQDVGVYLGAAGRWTNAAHIMMTSASLAGRIPGLAQFVEAINARTMGSNAAAGPSASERADSRAVVVARTLDGVGRGLTQAVVDGPSPYDLTAELLAWAAAMLLTGRATRAGALGPADAFGLDALVAGCAAIGLRRVTP